MKKSLFVGITYIARCLLYFLILWIRLPVKLLLFLLALVCFVDVAACLLFFRDYSMIFGFVGMGICSVFISWLLDIAVTILDPHGKLF
jgi:hypothetical protein